MKGLLRKSVEFWHSAHTNDKKVTYDTFCGKLHTYIMRTLVNGEDVVVVTKDTHINPMDVYTLENQPEDLTDKEQKLDIMKDTQKE